MNNDFGNAAAMREALVSVQNWCINKLGCSSIQVTVEGLLGIVNAALAAPPRNCDRFADAMDMFHAYREMLKSRYGSSANPNWVSLGKWLLAPAAERKGEGNESK